MDINLFVDLEALPGAIAALVTLGIELDREHAVARAERDGMFVGLWDGMRIDVFVPSIPFSHEAGRTVRVITVDGWTGRFLAPEAIALFTLLVFRPSPGPGPSRPRSRSRPVPAPAPAPAPAPDQSWVAGASPR